MIENLNLSISRPLKACPFCGAAAKLICHPECSGDRPILLNFMVMCKDCYSEGATFDSSIGCDIRECTEQAINAWNKREEVKNNE